MQHQGSRVHHPGPMTYDPNAIKRAVLLQSNKKNPPSIKFDTGKRDCNADISSNKLTPPLLSTTQSRYAVGSASPKPVRQAFSLGEVTACTPGPADYCPHAIRQGIMSTKSGNPSVSFGSPPRRRSGPKQRNPSAQEYDTESRRGVYSLSTKKRPAGFKFTV
ncbi:hypothetical protein ACHAWF_010495 [Thalassiosira exigua]